MSNKESLCACPNCKCRNGEACNCSPSCDCKMSNLEETKRESGLMVVQRVLLMVAVLCSSLGAGINATAADRPVEYRTRQLAQKVSLATVSETRRNGYP